MNQIIEITDFSAEELDIYARWNENQLLNRDKPEKGIFIAESPKVITRALDAGFEPISMLMETPHLQTQAKVLIQRCPHIPIYHAAFDVLTQITGFQLTRGVLCAMKRKPLPDIQTICESASRIAVLENVQNPANVGAAIRSAAALNFDAVLLTHDCSNPLYRRAIRVSMGTVFQIPWTILPDDRFDWKQQGSSLLHDLGFQIACLALKEDSVSILDERLNAEKKLAVVLGAEGDGLCETTIENSDYTVKIPMSHGVDSLNVAAAAAVAFWQLGKR